MFNFFGKKKVNQTPDVENDLGFDSTLDDSEIKDLKNPIVGMPKGHEGYSEKDMDQCPVMSGKIKNPNGNKPSEEEEEEEESSDSEEEEEPQIEMPKGHEQFTDADKEKCPVMSGKIKAPEGGDQPKKKKKKKMRGGCPFMPTDSKKAPALEHYQAAFEIPYVSTLRHLFSFRGLLSKDRSENPDREKFEQYPIFLKHTLFHNEEKFDKIRKLEVAHRFFVYDKFREQGNKKFNKNRAAEAISLYEHAMSCFKWLQMKEEKKDKKDEKKETDIVEKDEHLIDSNPNEETKEEGEEEKYDPLASLKKENKALYSILSDDNVELKDGEEITESNEKDMRNSMLQNIYLALSCCYIKLFHFSTALLALEEGFKINNGSSQLYFRRSQARAYNLGSSLEDLYKAKEDIAKAIEIKHYEKIFQSEPGILKILNIHNANEVYLEHAHYVEKRIKERTEEDKEAINYLFTRFKEVEKIEQAMLKQGRIPFDHEEDDDHSLEIKQEENMEYDIVKEMNSKYVKVIEFYLETDKKDQVTLARKEIQGTLEIHHKMKIYLDLDFKNWTDNKLIVECLKNYEDIDLTKPKTLKRIENFRLNKAKEIFESGKFNLEMFQYAVKEYFKRKEEIEKRKKEEEEQEKADDDEKPSRGWFSNIFGLEFGLQILVLLLLFGLFWYFNKNNLLGSFSTNKN